MAGALHMQLLGSLLEKGGCPFFDPPWSCKTQPAQVMAQPGVIVGLLVQSSSEGKAAHSEQAQTAKEMLAQVPSRVSMRA